MKKTFCPYGHFWADKKFFLSTKNIFCPRKFFGARENFFSKKFFFDKKFFFQKKSYNLKNHTLGTQWGTLKICRWNFDKNQQIMIFDDFGEIFDFSLIFWFCGRHLWASRGLGNRQTNKKMSETERGVPGNNFTYP